MTTVDCSFAKDIIVSTMAGTQPFTVENLNYFTSRERKGEDYLPFVFEYTSRIDGFNFISLYNVPTMTHTLSDSIEVILSQKTGGNDEEEEGEERTERA